METKPWPAWRNTGVCGGQGMTQQDISGNYRSTCPNSPQLLVTQLRITVWGGGVTWSCITEAWGCPGGPEISENPPISWSLCAALLELPQPWTKACRDGWLLHPLVLVKPAADLGQTNHSLSLVLIQNSTPRANVWQTWA